VKENNMKKVKITILKTTLDKELAAEYGIDGLRPVIMKLETNDEESKIDYHPIENRALA
jgi:hypothetical protein